MLDTKLKFSITFYPQTAGQIEVVHRSLGNLLRTLPVNIWKLEPKLPIAEFAYNTSVNRTIDRSPMRSFMILD